MMKIYLIISFFAVSALRVEAFLPAKNNGKSPTGANANASTRLQKAASNTIQESAELALQKRKLFELIGQLSVADSVLADPITKEPVEIVTQGVLLGDDGRRSRIQYKITSPSNTFEGSSDTYINLLEPVKDKKDDGDSNRSSQSPFAEIFRQALPYIPAPLRAPLASLTGGEEFIPMRDLFTSPAVSYAYERGWRQGFARAGFPGPDVEAEMAMDYFAPVVARTDSSVVVDMSCATGKIRPRETLLFLRHSVSHSFLLCHCRSVYQTICVGWQVLACLGLRLLRFHVDGSSPSNQCRAQAVQ